MFKEYEKYVNDRFFYLPKNSVLHSQLGYAALAMVSEAGEAGDAVKKILRGDDGITSLQILNECGDCLYYMQKLISLLGDYNIEDVMKVNIEKLNHRAIHGKENQS